MQLNLPAIICFIAAMLLLILALTIIIVPKIIRFINKRRYPFTGKIEIFRDVNAFIAHIDSLDFQEEKDGKLYKYNILNVNSSEKMPNSKGNYDIVDVFKGIYKSEVGNNYWFNIRYRINTPIRAFIWKHKDIINQQLSIQEKAKEKKLKEKEELSKSKYLDTIIRKNRIKIIK